MDKDKEIKKRVSVFNKIFAEIPEDKQTMVEDLIVNAAFMGVSLKELQEMINKNGMVSEYKNGENQYGTKKSPEVEVYATMIKNYSGIMKQLLDVLPDTTGKDELMDYIKEKR